jgi:hypothetical protein
VLNLHRFTKNPAHQRADGLNPTKAVSGIRHIGALRERLGDGTRSNDSFRACMRRRTPCRRSRCRSWRCG